MQKTRLDFDELVTLGVIEPIGFGAGVYYGII
jgi:hypothetical protein